VGHQRGRELLRDLRGVGPAARVPGQYVPSVGDIGAGEDGEQSVGGPPGRYDDDPNDAGAIRPCPLIKEPQELKQLAELDEGGRKVEADVQNIEQHQVVPDLAKGEQQEMATGSILDG
jgi:hypothetical protein